MHWNKKPLVLGANPVHSVRENSAKGVCVTDDKYEWRSVMVERFDKRVD